MARDFSKLDEFLDDEGLAGYLVNDDSENSTQKYLSGFDAPDPFTTLYAGGGVHLLVSGLEFGRAKSESHAETVTRFSDYDYRAKVEEFGPQEAMHEVVVEWLADHDVGSVAVPYRFPAGSADALRERDVRVEPESDGVVDDIRATKTDEELEYVREAQKANEAAMHAAEDLITTSTVDDEGVLQYEGEPLTSERVQEEIEVTLLRHGCALDETIVACGADAADPHDRGSGPLEAGEMIVIDIFPRDKASGYHADMTRTFVKGEATDQQREWYELTEAAMDAAYDVLAEGGVTGEAVHDAVCDVYEDAGHDTLRSNPAAETGFIHSTGHGVGLDVHEKPSLSPSGDELKPGHVITIEPGLYDPAVGGVRIEDIVVVTEDGYENLTDYDRELVVD